MKKIDRIISVHLFALFLVSWSASAATHPDKLGIGLSGAGDWALEFVNAAQYATEWLRLDGSPAAVDVNGWPTEDAQSCLFDLRLFGAWWGAPYDDGEERQPDVSGTYKLRFNGHAELRSAEPGELFVISNQHYDEARNLTTADVYIKGSYDLKDPENSNNVGVGEHSGLLALEFNNTDNGIQNLTLIRPDYHDRSEQTFTDEFLASLVPFPVLRFMDWTLTNNSNPYQKDPWPSNITRWDTNRNRITDATQRNWGNRRNQTAWEYVIELSNAAEKDPWICIPVSADDDYIKKLAILMHSGIDMGSVDVSGDYNLADGVKTCEPLNPNLKIYLEHSNEVWNYGFSQYSYNKMAAQEDAENEESLLSSDHQPDEEELARRRHMNRVIDIGHIFAEVFADQIGKGPMLDKIRPIYSHWFSFIDTQWEAQLKWASKHWKPLNEHLYALGGAPYFHLNGSLTEGESVDDILEHAEESIEENSKRVSLIELADEYGLKAVCYEGGPDSGGGKTINIQNRIRANRDPRIQDLIQMDLAENWFDIGGDIFIYFQLSGRCSRHGSWGAIEDVKHLDTPKYQALLDLIGRGPNAPEELFLVQDKTGKKLGMKWKETSDDNSQEEGFRIERADPYTGNVFREVGTSPRDRNRFVDTSIAPNVAYTYRVQAWNAQGNSSYSEPLSLITRGDGSPPPPNAFEANAISADQIEFRWIDQASGSESETQYDLERSSDDGEIFTAISTLTVDATTYTDRTVSVGSTYLYRLRATNAKGSSVWSILKPIQLVEKEDALPTPVAPDHLTATAKSASEILITWELADPTVTSLELFTAISLDHEFTLRATLPAEARSFSDSDLLPQTRYYYHLRAINSAGATHSDFIFETTAK